MALHRKWSFLLGLGPDIAILPEAASPEILESKGLDFADVCTVWKSKHDGSRNKGLLVVGFNGFRLREIADSEPPLDIFIPLEVSGPMAFPLLAVWSFNHRAALSKTPTPDALDRYRGFIESGALIAGDFNSNTVWDKGQHRNNFSNILDQLKRTGHNSVYHDVSGDCYGSERAATLYWRDRKEYGPRFMIDYIFEPGAWKDARTRFEIGRYKDWVESGLSDHVPLIIEWDRSALLAQLSGSQVR